MGNRSMSSGPTPSSNECGRVAAQTEDRPSRPADDSFQRRRSTHSERDRHRLRQCRNSSRLAKSTAIGLSGKTVAGARAALEWADVLMAEFHVQDDSHRQVMREAHDAGLGVLVKKGLAAGHLDPKAAIEFVLSESSVDSLVLGGLNLDHFTSNCQIATEVRSA